MALILAVALWSHVRSEVNPWETTTLTAPLAVRVPRGFVISSDARLPSSVQVTLRAPRQTLRELHGGAANLNPAPGAKEVQNLDADDEVRAMLDWTGARRGEQSVPVKIEVGAPDVEVVGTKPSDVVVSLAQAPEPLQ